MAKRSGQAQKPLACGKPLLWGWWQRKVCDWLHFKSVYSQYFCDFSQYRQTVIHNLPQLEKLDNVAISSQERVSEGLQISSFSVNCHLGGGSEVWRGRGGSWSGWRGQSGGHQQADEHWGGWWMKFWVTSASTQLFLCMFLNICGVSEIKAEQSRAFKSSLLLDSSHTCFCIYSRESLKS